MESEVCNIWRNIDGILKNTNHQDHKKQQQHNQFARKTPKTPERQPPKKRLQKVKLPRIKRSGSDEKNTLPKNIQLPNYSHDNIVMRMFFLRWMKKLAEKLQSNNQTENQPQIINNNNFKYIKGTKIDKLQIKKTTFVDSPFTFNIDFEMTSPSPSKNDLAFNALSDGSTINDISFSCSDFHDSFESLNGVQSGLEATIYDLSLSQLMGK